MSTSAHAWPTTSPSARSAARLKYHPPDNWLQHYLPDDRYKIAGGVWKFVSTQYDTYYHHPNSQYMLHQSAGIVIGFASEQEAIDAGYRKDAAMQLAALQEKRKRQAAERAHAQAMAKVRALAVHAASAAAATPSAATGFNNAQPAASGDSAKSDKREEDFNKFSNRAGKLANTPSSR